MAKKAQYYAEAERLYVNEHCSITEIASRLKLAYKTVQTWCDVGAWQDKRRDYIAARQSFHEELYCFARELIHGIREDMKAGVRVDPGRLYAATKLIPTIAKAKDYEEAAKKDAGSAPATNDDIVSAIQEALGIPSGKADNGAKP
jgi:hypothetical protein